MKQYPIISGSSRHRIRTLPGQRRCSRAPVTFLPVFLITVSLCLGLVSIPARAVAAENREAATNAVARTATNADAGSSASATAAADSGAKGMNAGASKVASAHRFLVQAGVLLHKYVFSARVIAVNTNSLDGTARVCLLKVFGELEAGGGLPQGDTLELAYPVLSIPLERDREYLFFVNDNDGLLINVYYPPLRLADELIRIPPKQYALTNVQEWIREARNTKASRFWKENMAQYREKRRRDREMAWRISKLRRCRRLLAGIDQVSRLTKKVEMMFELARLWRELGEYERAAEVYRELRGMPLGARKELMIARGNALLLFQKGDGEAAIAHIKALYPRAKLYPELGAQLCIDLGRLYEKQEQKAEARTWYKQAAGEYSGQYEQRAFAYFNLGEMARAEAQYERALSWYKRSMAIFRQYADEVEEKQKLPLYYRVLRQRLRRKGR